MSCIGITGIDTNVGKTIVSAIVTEALKADYWKMMQAGDLDALDSTTVKNLVQNSKTKILPEQFLLSAPMSPHAAAEIDGITIQLTDFKIPVYEQDHLIVEGAGGIMVPINQSGETIGDLFKLMVDEVILVSKHYLGSINHTLLSIAYLKAHQFKVKGIIFVGDPHPTTEDIILKTSGINCLGRIPLVDEITPEFVTKQAELLRENL